MHYNIKEIVYHFSYSKPSFKVIGELFDYLDYQVIDINGNVNICNLFDVHLNNQKYFIQSVSKQGIDKIDFEIFFELDFKQIKQIEEFRYQQNSDIKFDFNLNVICLSINDGKTKLITDKVPKIRTFAISLSDWKEKYISQIMNVRTYDFEIVKPEIFDTFDFDNLILEIKDFEKTLITKSLHESNLAIRQIFEKINRFAEKIISDKLIPEEVNSKAFMKNLQKLVYESYLLSSKLIHLYDNSNEKNLKDDNIDVEDIQFFFLHALNLLSYFSKKFYKREFIKKNI